MPKLNRDLIRSWLEDHNWSIQRLADECSALGDDHIPEGTMRNAVNGIDPIRNGRIKLIAKVTHNVGDGNGLTFEQLMAAAGDGDPDPDETEPAPEKKPEPKVERVAPPTRRNGKGDRRGPRRDEMRQAS